MNATYKAKTLATQIKREGLEAQITVGVGQGEIHLYAKDRKALGHWADVTLWDGVKVTSHVTGVFKPATA